MASASRRPSPPRKLRLQRYLAECGVGSRRHCESLIDQGLVSVDGAVVEQQGLTIDAATAVVRLRGKEVRAERKLYIALHKPRDVVCTSSDPQGRKTCLDFVSGLSARLYTIGRLDRDSEGLILLTNDGDFAHALSHPSHEVRKLYRVVTTRPIDHAQLAKLNAGVTSEGVMLRAERIDPIDAGGTRFELALREGRNRQVRRMFEAVNADIARLVRVRIGPLKLSGIRRGCWRKLTPSEVKALRSNAAGHDSSSRPNRAGRPASRSKR